MSELSVQMQAKITAAQVKRDLAAIADPEKAESFAWFFKTGKGEYGEGDRFLGITVPQQRKVAVSIVTCRFAISRLLSSPPFTSIVQSVSLFSFFSSNGEGRDTPEHFDFYLTHIGRINNWDLVDEFGAIHCWSVFKGQTSGCSVSVGTIRKSVGTSHCNRLDLAFVKAGRPGRRVRHFRGTARGQARSDPKSGRWVLRESGKISRPRQLSVHSAPLPADPRTALRYAIEHFRRRRGNKFFAEMVREAGSGTKQQSPPGFNHGGFEMNRINNEIKP